MVERRSPKPEVGVRFPPLLPKRESKREGKKMFNPLKFVQGVKQEAFKVTWPTKKEVLLGAFMVFILATVAAIFFLLLDQIYKFLLDIILTINF